MMSFESTTMSAYLPGVRAGPHAYDGLRGYGG